MLCIPTLGALAVVLVQRLVQLFLEIICRSLMGAQAGRPRLAGSLSSENDESCASFDELVSERKYDEAAVVLPARDSATARVRSDNNNLAHLLRRSPP